MKRHTTFTERLIEKLKNFQEAPINRTKDCIPNFKVFLAQVLSGIEAGVIDKTEGYDWMKIIRFMVEEGSRRLIGKSAEVPTRKQQANMLNNKKTDDIVKEAMEIKGLCEEHQLSQQEIMAKLSADPAAEEGKDEDHKVQALIEDEVNEMPWVETLQDNEHINSKLISKFDKSINFKLSWLKVFIKFLEIPSISVPSELSELECFNDPLINFAILFQNCLHPSNKLRREAIENGQYAEILSKEDAKKYFKSIYKNLIELEIANEETRIVMIQTANFNANISDMTLLIRDAYAFFEMIRGLKVGDGGVIALIRAMQKKNSLSPYQKLKIIVRRSFDGMVAFKDEYKEDPGDLKISSGNKYRLYIRYVYKNKEITDEEFKDIFPTITDEKVSLNKYSREAKIVNSLEVCNSS